jgi:hypothetical protein
MSSSWSSPGSTSRSIPSLYRRGLVSLLPQRHRATADDALRATGRALRLWLMGQLVAMILVGVLTTLGLWLIGVPSALALGVIAALLEFVPFAGPVLASSRRSRSGCPRARRPARSSLRSTS